MGSPAKRGAIIALALALEGCKDYDSAVPLGPASEGVIEPGLLGTWSCTGTEEDAKPGTIAFLQFDETQYYVRPEGEDEEATPFRAYSSVVGELFFLNLQELRESGNAAERGWIFMHYSFPGDGVLRLQFVAPSLFDDLDGSSESARQALEGALADPETLDDGLTCSRPFNVRSKS